MANFRKLYDTDVSALNDQLASFKEWGANDLRTSYPGSAHADVSDIWLRYPEFKDRPPGDIQNDMDCIDYPAWQELPEARALIQELMDHVDGDDLGRVIITRLKTGGKISPHIDQGVPAELYDRYHIVLQSDDGNLFHAGDETVHMKPGEVWWFDNQALHSLENNSQRERIHLIADIL